MVWKERLPLVHTAAGIGLSGRVLTVGVYGYLLLMLCVTMVVRFAGDQWWLATVLLFSPRWLFAVPVIVLIPFAAWHTLWLLVPLAVTSMIIVFPLMGYNLPLKRDHSSVIAGSKMLRIATLNVDSGRLDAARLFDVIRRAAVDIAALQECPLELEDHVPAGWYMVAERGLAVISRYPVTTGRVVQVTAPRSNWPGTYLLQTVVHAPGGDLAFCSLQFPTARFGLQQVLDRYTILSPSRKDLLVEETGFRWRVALETQRNIEALKLPVIIAGDFNTPADSPLYRQVWNEYANAFSSVGLGFGWTQRVDIKGLPFSTRIDHILSGRGLTPRLCQVGPDVGSDHLLLLADISRNPTH